jgi:hypothetical protein
VVVLLLPLSSATDNSEFNNIGGGGGGGGSSAAVAATAAAAVAAAAGVVAVDNRDGIQWRWWWGRSMAVAVWQPLAAVIDYGEAILRGRRHLAVAVGGNDGKDASAAMRRPVQQGYWSGRNNGKHTSNRDNLLGNNQPAHQNDKRVDERSEVEDTMHLQWGVR